MMELIVLNELAEARQQELMREAETQRLLSQVRGKKPGKVDSVRQAIRQLVNRGVKFLRDQGVFPRKSDRDVSRSDIFRLVN